MLVTHRGTDPKLINENTIEFDRMVFESVERALAKGEQFDDDALEAHEQLRKRIADWDAAHV